MVSRSLPFILASLALQRFLCRRIAGRHRHRRRILAMRPRRISLLGQSLPQLHMHFESRCLVGLRRTRQDTPAKPAPQHPETGASTSADSTHPPETHRSYVVPPTPPAKPSPPAPACHVPHETCPDRHKPPPSCLLQQRPRTLSPPSLCHPVFCAINARNRCAFSADSGCILSARAAALSNPPPTMPGAPT